MSIGTYLEKHSAYLDFSLRLVDASCDDDGARFEVLSLSLPGVAYNGSLLKVSWDWQLGWLVEILWCVEWRARGHFWNPLRPKFRLPFGFSRR